MQAQQASPRSTCARAVAQLMFRGERDTFLQIKVSALVADARSRIRMRDFPGEQCWRYWRYVALSPVIRNGNFY